MSQPLRSYQDLRVWQAGMRLVVASYRLSGRFPKSEAYGLTSQIRRAAVSVAANIAEGYGRTHRGDYIRHVSVANGSLKELETELTLSNRLGYLRDNDYRQAMCAAEEVGRMLTRLLQKLREHSPTPYTPHPTPSC